MSKEKVDQLVQELQALAAAPPPEADRRKQLCIAAQRLAWSLETPHDTIYRVLYSPVILTIAEIASNMQIFQTLTDKHGTPCTTAELATPKSADLTLTGRIARWLAGHGMIDEIDEDLFAGNATTKTLSIEGFRGGMTHYVQTTMPPLQVLSDFLEETKYANPNDLFHSPFQKAMNTTESKFVWQRSRPALTSAFGLWMAAQHDKRSTWLNVLDFQEFTQNTTPETPVFVDVAGGIGHQCALLKEKYPNLVGRVILEDTENVVQNALPTPGVETIAIDFWESQPVKGSRAYYFRYIMHDYPDDKCRIILKNIIAAMGPDSVILIDEVVLPNKGAHPNSLDKDIVMMVNFGAVERTTKQWQSLFESCDLKLLKSAVYNEASGETIQVVGRK